MSEAPLTEAPKAASSGILSTEIGLASLEPGAISLTRILDLKKAYFPMPSS